MLINDKIVVNRFLLFASKSRKILMRTSCRVGVDSIEYTSGSDALQFFGFRLDLFQINSF